MSRKLIVEIVGNTAGLERSFARASGSSKGFERDIGRASRGALSAAVSFQGLGRAMAFSSAQFLGGAGIVFALKSTIQAAEESQRVLGQTSVAVGRAGLSWAKYGKDIEAAALAQSNLSGFDDERLLGTFSKLLRATGSVTEAMKDNALAVNVARGANIELEKAAQIVGRASVGQAKGLVNIGIAARKGASGTELLALINQKFSGSAVAFGKTAVGAQERFRVAIENTQEALGKGALPAITKYLNKASDWLNQSKNQERIQRDVAEAVHVLGDAVKVAGTVVEAAADAFKTFSGVVGGSKHALELLAAVVAGFKVVKILEGLAAVGGATRATAAGIAAANATVATSTAAASAEVVAADARIVAANEAVIASNVAVAESTVASAAAVGTAAKAATAEVGLLRGALLGLGRLGAIAIPITVALSAKWISESDIGKKLGLDFSGLDLAHDITKTLGGGHLVSADDVKRLLAGGATPIDIAQKFGSFLDDSGRAALKTAAEAASKASQEAAAASAKVNLFSGNVPTFATGPAFAPPKPPAGRANLSPFDQAKLDLSTAALTDSTVDDLKALNTQHELLAKKIDAETARLKNAPTAKAAKKFAAELERLNSLDADALSQIEALQKKSGHTPNDLAARRNTFFDNRIARLISQVQDAPIKNQIAKLQTIAGLITARIAATKDVTRRLTLEDQLADVRRSIKSTSQGIAADAASLFDSTISRALDHVQDLPIGKQIGQLTKISSQIAARIAATKDVQAKLVLEDTLAGVRRTIAATGKSISDTAAQLFDSNLSRALDQITDLPVAKQIAQLKHIAAQITARIAATQDVQRKRTLEDELTGVRRTIKATSQSIADTAAGLFDSNLSRALDSVQDIPTIQGQIAKLTAIGATITARIAATKDIAKKKALEDTLLASVTRPLAADRAQLAQNFLDSLSLDVTQADATGNLAKSLATLTALAAGLKKQIAEGVNVASNKAKLSDTLRNIADTKTAVGKKILDALDFGVTKAEATGSLSKQLAANAALQAGLKKQIAASKDATDLQRQLFAAEQHRLDLLKQGREKARQAVTDRLQLAADRADATPGLKDNLATRLAQIEVIRKQIQAQGSTNALQEQLLAKENEAKAIRRQIAQAPLDLKAGGLNLARQAADFAITRAGTNLKLLDKATQLAIAVDKKQIAFLKGRIAASKGLARQGFQADLATKQVDLFGLNQTQAAAAKTRLEKSQLAALGLTAEGTLVLPHEAIAKEFKRVGASIAGTEFDTPANRKVFKRIGQDIKDGWKGVTATAKAAATAYLDTISDTLTKGVGDQTKFHHISAKKVLAGLGLSPDQIRALSPRIAQIGAGGTIPQRTQQFALAGGGPGGGGGTTIHIENFHSSAPNIRALEEEFEKRARSRAANRRGAR